MKITLVCLIGDDFRGSALEAATPADLLPLLEAYGFDYSHDADARSPIPLRQGWPVFNGLVGPLLGHDGGIRYEDDDSHDILTA